MFFLADSDWEVKKTPTKGKGIFSKTEILPGTIIGDYLGMVVRPEDEETIQDESCFYLMWYHDRASIFPDLEKPGIHLLNHSCTPNTWMYTYKGHTLFFALRHIFPGEELTVNYLLSPLDESCKPCQHLCKCNTVLCHSTMHLTEKKYAKWSAFHEEEMQKTKPERIRYNQMLPKLSSYPKSTPDDPIYTLFGTETQSSFTVNDKRLPSTAKLRNLIRETGQTLSFPALNLQILGIEDNVIYSMSL